MKRLFLVLTFACITTALNAQSGLLDSTFNSTGLKIFNIGDGSSEGRAVLVQPDQRILIAGSARVFVFQMAVVRMMPDGSEDPSFGSGGKVYINAVPGMYSHCYAMALQPDGKILLAGTSQADTLHYGIVVRLLQNGTLDSTFGTGGVASTNIGNGAVVGMALQNDGKIVLSGWIRRGPTDSYLVMRFSADGKPDNGFGSGGMLYPSFGDAGCYGTNVVLQTDGKIVVTGYVYNNGTFFDIALLRLNSDGTPDNGFGKNGIVSTDLRGTLDQGLTVALQPDGKIIVGGTSTDVNVANDWAIVRYNSNGSLDSSFNGKGFFIQGFGIDNDDIYAVTAVSGGKILAVGTSGIASALNSYFTIVRFNSDGTFDKGFGDNGLVRTSLGPIYATAFGVAIQNDGKILLGGTTSDGGIEKMSIVRYQLGGTTGVIASTGSLSSVRLIPNPTSGTTSLDITLRVSSVVSVTATDINGRVIAEPITRAMLGEGKHTIPLMLPESLPAGIYPVMIDVDGKRQVVKLIRF